jgi:hypothetical protein
MMIKNSVKQILAAFSLVLLSASVFADFPYPDQYTCTLVGPLNTSYAATTGTRKHIVGYSDLVGDFSGDVYMAYRDAWNSATSDSYTGIWTFTRLFQSGETPTEFTVVLFAPARSINFSPALANRLGDITNSQRMVVTFSQLAAGYTNNVRIPLLTNPRSSKWKLVDATVTCKFL